MADILIRGMEMPTNAFDCPLNSFGICNLAHDSNHTYCIGDSRPEWCPLVPIPEGHGRLIDAERFRVILCRLKDRMVDDEAIHAVQWAIECLDKLDTIVPAEGGTDDEHI